MRVFINRKPISGPWGGGSKVLSAIISALTAAGHDVVHGLVPGIDVLLCVDPRPGSEPGLCGYNEIHQYAYDPSRAANRPRIVQRVGDVGTHGKPELTKMVLAAAYHSDTAVFPSAWAHDYVQHTLLTMDRRTQRQWHVVQNAPARVFYRNRRIRDTLPNGASFVTHHWSNNPMKGFDCYKELETHLAMAGHCFLFIGRQPDGKPIRNAIEPMTDVALAEELPRHDVYVTASLQEAGANHVLEAIAAGLPVIYHQGGGSINEYCAQFGVSFDGSMESFADALTHVRVKMPHLARNLRKYRTTIDDQAQKYVGIIESIRA